MEIVQPTEEWLKRHAPIGSGASLPDGTVVGRWHIVAFVARGGTGEVYRAIDEVGNRVAALKILHRTDEAAQIRFQREASVLSGMSNRAFPAFFESGELDGRPWCATEFLQPLEMPSSDDGVARLVLAVCRAAGALHALGYVHRDIKPANIMSRNGEPVLIDLGLLKKAGAPAVRVGGTVSVVDGRPVGVGTPGYAAPEQFLGGEISPSADIHAIGVLASTCFGGRPPRSWRGIIRRATSSLPSERYPDVTSLARAVRMRHLPAALALGAIAAAIALVAALRPHGHSPLALEQPVPVAAETAEATSPVAEPIPEPVEEPVPEPEPVEEPESEMADESVQEVAQDATPILEPAPVVEPEPVPTSETAVAPNAVSAESVTERPVSTSSDNDPEMDIETAEAEATRASRLVAEGIEACRHEYFGLAGKNIWKALDISRDLVKRFGNKYSFILAKSEVAYAEFHHLANPDIGNMTPLAYVGAGIALLEKLPGNGDGETKAELNKAISLQKKILLAKGLKLVYSEQLKEKRIISPKRKAVAKLAEDMVQIPGRDYAICKSETTQALWKEVMEDFMKDAREAAKEDPEHMKNVVGGMKGIENPSSSKGADLPVSNVSISDVQTFLGWLNKLPEVKFYGFEYRLPTAEEWEYACLAGGTNGFCRLADGMQVTAGTLGEAAWFAANSKNKPHPVCTKKPNAFGLYDMHGNVAEFTSTQKPGDMFEYIWKGNAYNGDNPEDFRADLMYSIPSFQKYDICGFRLAL